MDKMNRWLLGVGGAWNALFTLFHVLSAYGIQTTPGLTPEVRALLQMLNAGVILLLVFATYVSFARGRDLMTTGLGRTTSAMVAVFYGVRAAEEIVLSPAFSPVIFGMCLLGSTVYTLLALRAAQASRVARGVYLTRPGSGEDARRVQGRPLRAPTVQRLGGQ